MTSPAPLTIRGTCARLKSVSKLHKHHKTSQRRRSLRQRRPLLIIIFILFLAAAFAIFQLISLFSQGNRVVEEQKIQSDFPIQPLSESTGSSENSDGNAKTPRPYEGEDVNQLEHLTGYFSIIDLSGNTLIVRAVINQFIQNGTCTLTMSHSNGSVITKTSKIIANPSTSSCDGFDIPVSELSKGKYKVNLKLDSANKTGTITGEAHI